MIYINSMMYGGECHGVLMIDLNNIFSHALAISSTKTNGDITMFAVTDEKGVVSHLHTQHHFLSYCAYQQDMEDDKIES
jgi:hypothetical protein